MATIQYGRAVAAGGFSRAVAIKRLHPQFAKDPAFVSMFLDEARLAARIAHANVVPTLDVLSGPGELAVVMEYVNGESLARLMRRTSERGELIPIPIGVTLIAGVLHGLHAAHETTDDHGEALHIVHRDVSPENVLVGIDGVPRLIDFGIARAQGRSRITPAGELKGKLAYMAVEQYKGIEVDRRVDVYGASVVLWEALTGRELFGGDSDATVVNAVMEQAVLPPRELRPELPAALEAIVMRGLSRDRNQRFSTAREMALALEREVGVVPQSAVSDWLEREVGEMLAQRASMLRRQSSPRAFLAIEDGFASTRVLSPPPEPVQEATASLPSDAPSPRRQSGLRTIRPPRRPVLVGAIALLLLAGGTLYLTRSHGIEARSVAPDSTAPAAQVAPQTASPSTTPAPTPASAAQQPSSPRPAATSQPRAAQAAPADAAPSEVGRKQARSLEAPAPPATRQRRPKAATRETKAQNRDCLNPFDIDERGIRRARTECL